MKTILKTIVIFSFLVIFTQAAQADTCTYAGGTVSSSELASCSEPGADGQDCRPYGWWYQGGCTEESEIQSDASWCYARGRVFDGDTGCTTQCTSGSMCLSGDTCIASVDPDDCRDTYHRNLICGGECGAKVTGYEYCTTTAGATGCSPSNPLYGFVCERQECATPGKETANYCTGECTSCTGDYVEFPAGSGNCVLPTDVVYDDDFYGYTGSDWNLFLTVENWVDEILEQLITELVNDTDFVDQLTSNSEFVTNINNVVSGIGEYVGVSNTAVNGSRGGYEAANDACANKDFGGDVGTGSHICSPQEIINTYNNGGTLPGSGTYWVNNGNPAYISNVVNDCNGWSNPSSTIFGYVWLFASDYGAVSPCNETYQFACCK